MVELIVSNPVEAHGRRGRDEEIKAEPMESFARKALAVRPPRERLLWRHS